jgi:hypothetical protein
MILLLKREKKNQEKKEIPGKGVQGEGAKSPPDAGR